MIDAKSLQGNGHSEDAVAQARDQIPRPDEPEIALPERRQDVRPRARIDHSAPWVWAALERG